MNDSILKIVKENRSEITYKMFYDVRLGMLLNIMYQFLTEEKGERTTSKWYRKFKIQNINFIFLVTFLYWCEL